MQVSARDYCASRAWLQRQLQFATKTHWQHFNECCSRRRSAACHLPPTFCSCHALLARQTMKLAYESSRSRGSQNSAKRSANIGRESRVSKCKACGRDWPWDWVFLCPMLEQGESGNQATRQPGNQTRAQGELLWHRHFCMRRMVAFFGLTVGCDAVEEQETAM